MDDPRTLLSRLGEARTLEVSDDGIGRMELVGGELKVTVFPQPGTDTASKKTGLDFHLPSGLVDDQCREMITFCLALAADWEMEIYDPQLGKTVSRADGETIFMHFKDQNSYLLHTVGSNGSVAGGGAYYPEYESSMSGRTMFWLAIAGLLVGFLVLVRFCT